MSRTYKDAPYRVRARRHGVKITSCGPDCGKPRTLIDTHHAAILSTEKTLLADIQKMCEEYGYELEITEKHGYFYGIFSGARQGINTRYAPTRTNPLRELLQGRYGKVLDKPTKSMGFLLLDDGECPHCQVAVPKDTQDLCPDCVADSHSRFVVQHFPRQARPNLYLEITATRTVVVPHSCPATRGEYLLPAGLERHYCSCYFCSQFAKKRIQDKMARQEVEEARAEGLTQRSRHNVGPHHPRRLAVKTH